MSDTSKICACGRPGPFAQYNLGAWCGTNCPVSSVPGPGVDRRELLVEALTILRDTLGCSKSSEWAANEARIEKFLEKVRGTGP